MGPACWGAKALRTATSDAGAEVATCALTEISLGAGGVAAYNVVLRRSLLSVS